MSFHPTRRCPRCGARVAADTLCPRCTPPRPSAAARGYGHAWQVYAATFLRAFPRCGDRPPETPPTDDSRCAAEGRPVPAEVVDHVTPHRGDPVLLWDRGNHQSLCSTCHNRKTGTKDTPAAARWLPPNAPARPPR